jgi:5-dehydro-2-deoxygluconokinase
MVMQTENEKDFEPKVFDKTNMLESERRGKGLLNDVSYRIVRTVFDKRNRPESNLVVGEIITFSGHWSSCPSHFHEQPEIYYYRFSEPQGFAIGEDGEKIKRIKQNDTMVILDEKEHSHSTSPGYALYTLWFIRHLKNKPYIVPTFKSEHEWARHPSANQRVWRPLEDI